MINRKPYLLLFAATVVLLMCYFFTSLESKSVLNYNDTYFVVLKRHILLFFIFLFGICSLIYFILDILKLQLFKKGIWIHIAGIILSTGFFFLLGYLYDRFEEKQKSFEELVDPPNFNLYIGMSILISISLQFFFLINIFVSITKKFRNSATWTRA